MKKEQQIEEALIKKLQDLKYIYRPDIRDKAALEQNFRQKFEALNRVNLTDTEFARLRDEIVTADVFTAAKSLHERNTLLTIFKTNDCCSVKIEAVWYRGTH